jgi:hypothetical protein
MALSLACQCGFTASRKRSSSRCARSSAARAGGIGGGAEREPCSAGIKALQVHQPELVIIQIPAGLGILGQDGQHALRPGERRRGHRLAAAAILFFLGGDPAHLHRKRHQLRVQVQRQQQPAQIARRGHVVELGERLAKPSLAEMAICSPQSLIFRKVELALVVDVLATDEGTRQAVIEPQERRPAEIGIADRELFQPLEGRPAPQEGAAVSGLAASSAFAGIDNAQARNHPSHRQTVPYATTCKPSRTVKVTPGVSLSHI